MRATKFSLPGLLLLILLFSGGYGVIAQVPYLERKISGNFKETPADQALKQISDQGGFTFSYAQQVISDVKPQTFQYRNKAVREVLDNLFSGQVSYKEKGKHVILQKMPPKSEEKQQEYFIVSGYVTDGQTGNQVSSASIYDKSSRVSAVTNQYGYFNMKISQQENLKTITLYVNKEKYKDTIVYINQSGRSILNLTIYPDQKIVSYVDSSAINDSIFTVNRLALVNMILSEQEQANTRNIKDTLNRKFQFSFLPYLGTNLKLSGNTVNDYSLNVLAGYSMGTRKLEIAGLVNVDRDSVKYAQIAGLLNITGGPVQGAQIAGLVNYNIRPVKGVQVAGLVNTNMDSSKAASIAGLLNVNLKSSQGVQVAGLLNFNLKSCSNAQAAGLLNIAVKNMEGAQIAGLMNVALDDIKGVQIAGLINIARSIHGSQIGFLNIADTCTGIPVGFLSFVRKGYHELEISSNEIYPVNLSFRTGVRQLYNIFEAGMQFKTPEEHTWYYGYGVGSSVILGSSWQLNFDLTMNQPMRANRLAEFNPLTKFNITAEKRLSKGVAIAFGPSLNVLYANINDADYDGYLSRNPPGSFSSSDISGDYKRSVWLGAKAALRFF